MTELARFEYYQSGKTLNKGLEKNYKNNGILERLSNINDANEKQLQVIKDDYVNQLERLKDDKRKLKSTKYFIDKQNKEQVRYFEMLVNLELKID